MDSSVRRQVRFRTIRERVNDDSIFASAIHNAKKKKHCCWQPLLAGICPISCQVHHVQCSVTNFYRESCWAFGLTANERIIWDVFFLAEQLSLSLCLSFTAWLTLAPCPSLALTHCNETQLLLRGEEKGP